MAFNPNDHMMSLKGKQYLPVNARVAWFREEHPDWTILTSFVPELSGSDYATFRCDIMETTGRIIATGHKTEHAAHFPDFREKAETGSIGRSLALCGYGTLFAQELETPETPAGDLRIVDAPVAPKVAKPAPSSGPDELTKASIQFKDAIEQFEDKVSADRLKKVFRILTNNAERNVQSLRTATTMLIGCGNEDEYRTLLSKLAKDEDAPF